jgi:O-antigen ligase
VTISTFDTPVAIGEISFNLSGPFLLAVSCMLFANLPPGSINLAATASVLLGPIVSIATLTSSGLLSTEIVFGTGSNVLSSGGFGPNQVSSALGLGAVAAVALAMGNKSKLAARVAMLSLGLVLLSLSALTFSRGGLYTALAACFLGGLALAADRRARLRIVVVSGLFVALGGYWILPKLVSYTQGALGARLESTNTTGRDELFRGDLEAWREHPLLGTGPGGSQRYHERSVTTHTEYSRLVAEHGVFGLGALAVLIVLVIDVVRRTRSRERRAVVLALFTWSLLFMMHAAMRVAAPAFLFGMAFYFGAEVSVMRRSQRRPLDLYASPRGGPATVRG